MCRDFAADVASVLACCHVSTCMRAMWRMRVHIVTCTVSG